jgi:predicted amidophosphoribosyltransferase
MGMITSRVESVCVMCDRAVGRGRWQLCPACEAATADAIDRRLGPVLSQTCLGCGSTEAVAGRYCSRCQREIYTAKNLEPQPDGAEPE